VAEFFAPRLGGRPDAWSEANRVVVETFFDLAVWDARLRAAEGDYDRFDRAYQLDWLGGMCVVVGVPRPPDEEALDLARDADLYVTRRVRAAFPGAAEAIRALRARGYRLCTASGESSRELDGYLQGMGVREHFDRLYGPDLIATFKSGPAYYERLLADAGVPPAHALVVDDSPRAIVWAASAGARAVLVGTNPCPDAARVIASLRELPEVIERVWESRLS
jgi:HAD superfamily hydrolase (TIGR01509 family)